MLDQLAKRLKRCEKHDEEIAQLRDDLHFYTNLLLLMPYGVRTHPPGVIPPRLPLRSSRHHVRPQRKGPA
jgi:hypothetical protein